jgi:hypothetical protein
VVAAGTALRRRTGHSCARKAVAGGDAVTTLEPTRPGERQAPPTGELQGDVFLVQTLGSKLGGFWAISFEGLECFIAVFRNYLWVRISITNFLANSEDG